jgi:hypothetical protein
VSFPVPNPKFKVQKVWVRMRFKDRNFKGLKEMYNFLTLPLVLPPLLYLWREKPTAAGC